MRPAPAASPGSGLRAAGCTGEAPGVHQERGGGEVDAGLGGAVGLDVVAEDGFLRGVEGAVVAVEDPVGVDAVGRAEDEAVDGTPEVAAEAGPSTAAPHRTGVPPAVPLRAPARLATWCWMQLGKVVPSPTMKEAPQELAPRMLASQRCEKRS